MRRWLFYLLLIAAVSLFGGKRSGKDISQLQPTQVVWVAAENGQLQILAETGEMGQGANFAAAVADMENTASKEIFWDTVDYLLFTPEAESCLPEAQKYFRPSCRIFLCREMPDLVAVRGFLERRETELTLGRWVSGMGTAPELKISNGRIELVS